MGTHSKSPRTHACAVVGPSFGQGGTLGRLEPSPPDWPERSSRMTLWRGMPRASEEWLRKLNEKVLAEFIKTPLPKLRRSNRCGGLDGVRGALARGGVLVPQRTAAFGSPVSQPPSRKRVARRRTEADPRVGADGAHAAYSPILPTFIEQIGAPPRSRPRRRRACRPTKRNVCRRAGWRAGLRSEVPVDGSFQRSPRLGTDAPSLVERPAELFGV